MTPKFVAKLGESAILCFNIDHFNINLMRYTHFFISIMMLSA